MFKSLPKNKLCICQKYLLNETFLFSTKIKLKLMDTRSYTVNITLNFFLTLDLLPSIHTCVIKIVTFKGGHLM